MKKVIAGVQTDVAFADKAANLEKMLSWLEHDSCKIADLVVFPECMLSGYCFRSKEEAMPIAESVPGPATDVLTKWCQIHHRFVAFGMLEIGLNGELYNSCPIVGPNGLVGCYRKIHLPYLGVDRFVTTGPEPYRVHDLNGLRIGTHICYDASFPESSRVMALQGADLLILPTNWPPGATTFAKFLPNARALENNVYFMSVNRIGTERGFRFIGESRLCGVDGEAISEIRGMAEGVIVGTIDPQIARTKRLVRVPGEHIIDRFADRHPEFYSELSIPHHLTRPIDDCSQQQQQQQQQQ